jgi:hypothetical protein
MAEARDGTTLHVAIVSAVTAVTTAHITAMTTVYTTNQSAAKSAETAADQATRAQTAAGQAQTRLSSLVPQGAVIAFQTPCPDGWMPFDAANGRFVLGASERASPGASGGKSDLVFEYIGEGQYSTTGTATYRPSQNQDGVRNGDRVMQVSMLPPYVVLRYCVKT